jgi:hypothetical protein
MKARVGFFDRAISELMSEAERLLKGSRSRIADERKIIARRRAIGADLKESMELLKRRLGRSAKAMNDWSDEETRWNLTLLTDY